MPKPVQGITTSKVYAVAEWEAAKQSPHSPLGTSEVGNGVEECSQLLVGIPNDKIWAWKAGSVQGMQTLLSPISVGEPVPWGGPPCEVLLVLHACQAGDCVLREFELRSSLQVRPPQHSMGKSAIQTSVTSCNKQAGGISKHLLPHADLLFARTLGRHRAWAWCTMCVVCLGTHKR